VQAAGGAVGGAARLEHVEPQQWLLVMVVTVVNMYVLLGAAAPKYVTLVCHGCCVLADVDNDSDEINLCSSAPFKVLHNMLTSYCCCCYFCCSSSGLKRYSVTLFKGGRVGGPAVIDELITSAAQTLTRNCCRCFCCSARVEATLCDAV
jgi:hypothetical protein